MRIDAISVSRSNVRMINAMVNLKNLEGSCRDWGKHGISAEIRKQNLPYSSPERYY
jgi:hypothetical protein